MCNTFLEKFRKALQTKEENMTSRGREGTRITVEYGDDLLAKIEEQKAKEGYVSLSEFLRQMAMDYLADIRIKENQNG